MFPGNNMESSVIHLVYAVLYFTVFINISFGNSLFYNKTIFSTKTPYFWTRSLHENFDEDSETFFDVDKKFCQALHISSVLRHGTRYPQLNWVKKMKTFYEKLENENIDGDLEFVNSFTEEKEGSLSKLGEIEQFELGRRFGTRFKLLFEEDLNNMKFFASSKQRAYSSSQSFYKGLTDTLDQGDKSQTVYGHTIDDIMLRFHDNCDKYIGSIDNNKTAMTEYYKFKDGPEMKKVVLAVNNRLTGKDDKFSTEDILIIHQICAFELAFQNSSEWCKYFNEEELKVIEYLMDLKQYWKKVYGYQLNWKMSCPLVSHIFKEMDKVIEHNRVDEDYTIGIFRFGHAETVAPLYAVLGLFNDSEIPRADNYQSQKDRLFRSSHLMQFSMNIAFALYECEEEDRDDDEDDDESLSNVFIKIFVNEEAVVIPACGQTLCLYSEVRDQLKDYIDNCNFKKLCSTKHSSHDEL